MDALSTEAIERWLANHAAAIAAGMNVGQIDRDKAQRFRIELSKRSHE